MLIILIINLRDKRAYRNVCSSSGLSSALRLPEDFSSNATIVNLFLISIRSGSRANVRLRVDYSLFIRDISSSYVAIK